MDEDTIDACCQVIQDRIDQLEEASPDADEEGWRSQLDYGMAQLEGVRWTIQQMKELNNAP